MSIITNIRIIRIIRIIILKLDLNYHNTHNQHNEYNQHNYPVRMSQVFEWHIPENVVDQINNVLVQGKFFFDKFIRGRATDTHNKIDSGTAQQALKQIILA